MVLEFKSTVASRWETKEIGNLQPRARESLKPQSCGINVPRIQFCNRQKQKKLKISYLRVRSLLNSKARENSAV